jgi:ABC-type polysaccharide/polyol phosphate transport system ATPase subunit
VDNNIAIRVQNLTKIYHLYDKPQDRLKEALNPFRKSYHHDFYAMEDVSFEIKKGETVGIIGKNGAGKSTLLKMITGVLTQTSGSIDTNGKIASLLELGTGFNPEMSGVENIYLNGSIMGFSKKEIDEKIDAIIEFADIGEHMLQPVKTYSSGMFARLGFAVAINVDPEILIVDEALSVGDMNFQVKCMTAMTRIQKRGTTILFVSHDINSVKSLCQRGLYIEGGKLIAIGNASVIGEKYEMKMREVSNTEHEKKYEIPEKATLIVENLIESKNQSIEFKTSKEFENRVSQFRHGTGCAKITYVELVDSNENLILEANFNQDVKLRIFLETYTKGSISVNFQLQDDKKINIAACSFMVAGKDKIAVNDGDRLIVEYKFQLPLQHNTYSIQTMIIDPIINDINIHYIDVIPDAYIFKINKRPNSTLWSKVDLFPELNIKRVI